MGLTSTGIIGMKRLRVLCQTIKIINTDSLNSNTICVLDCPLKKTIYYTSIYQDESVHKQTTTICNTNPIHFLPLSLFFLPLTFFLANIISSSDDDDDVTTILQTLTSFKTLSIVILSTITATCLITYTTHQTIRCKPLTFSSTFNSLSHSFLPMLSTFLAGIIGIALVIASFLGLGLGLGLGFRFEIIQVLCSVVALVSSLLCVVTCGLAPPIAVLESKYGLHSLIESFNNLSLMIWFGFLELLTGTISAVGLILCYSCASKKKESLPPGLLFMLVSITYLLATLIMVHYVVYTVVLYVRAKAARGGHVVVQTMMRVSHEDRRVPTSGWFSRVMAGCFLVIIVNKKMLL